MALRGDKLYCLEYSLLPGNYLECVKKIKCGKAKGTVRAGARGTTLAVATGGKIKMYCMATGKKLRETKALAPSELFWSGERIVLHDEERVILLDSELAVVAELATDRAVGRVDAIGDSVLVDGRVLYRQGELLGRIDLGKGAVVGYLAGEEEFALLAEAPRDTAFGGRAHLVSKTVPLKANGTWRRGLLALPAEEAKRAKRAPPLDVVSPVETPHENPAVATASKKPRLPPSPEGAYTIEDRLRAVTDSDEESLPPRPTTESLGAVLAQALRSKDDSTLESAVLSHHYPPHVMRSTVEDIDAELLDVLLERLVLKLAQKPSRAVRICAWTRLVLDAKMANGGGFGGSLVPLKNIIMERIDMNKDFVMLEGRLGFICGGENDRQSLQKD